MLKEKILKLRKKVSFKNIKKVDFKKGAKFLPLVLILVMIGLVLPSNFAHADLIMEHIVYPVIYVILSVLFEVAYVITWIGASLLNAVLNPTIMNKIFANEAIYEGWTIIRDICNLLFLLIMLLVAFGTILQSEKYNIKNSLSKLIIAIFLINFSFPIAGVIVDFGNILMYGILAWRCPSESATCFQDFYAGLMTVVRDFRSQYSWERFVFSNTTNLQAAIGLGIATIYTYMYGFILLAMAGFLLVRTVALALLLILAPFAYFGEVMPGMENLGKKWWDNIWSYTLFGPIFALMFFISGELARNILTMKAPPLVNTDLGALGPIVSAITVDILPLLFLLAIIPITKSLGLAGTETIMKNTVGAGTGLAKFVGGVADRYMARGAQPGHGIGRRILSNLSLGAWKRAIKAHNADNEHDYSQAAGKVRRRYVHRASDWIIHKSPVDYQKDAYEHDVARQNKDILTENSDELGQELKKALDRGMISRAEAIARKLAAKGDLNNAMQGMGYENSQAGFIDFMDKEFKALEPKGIASLKSDLAQAEKSAGNHSFKGTSEYKNTRDFNDPKSKDKWEWVNNDKKTSAEKAAKEFGKVEPQAKMRNLDKRTILDEVDDLDSAGNKQIDATTGKTKKKWILGKEGRGEKILDDLTQADIANVRKAKPEQLREILKALKNTDSSVFDKTKERKTNVEAFMKEIENTLKIGTTGDTKKKDPYAERDDGSLD